MYSNKMKKVIKSNTFALGACQVLTDEEITKDITI